jgi:hypothetical protein
MGKGREDERLTDEALEAQHAEEIPERVAMSALGLPVTEAPEPSPSDIEH